MTSKRRPPDEVETELLGDAAPMAAKDRPPDDIDFEHVERGKRGDDDDS